MNIVEKQAYKKAYTALNEANFLQSWEWGSVQQQAGNDVERLLIDQQPIQAIVRTLPLGVVLVYLPRLSVECLRDESAFLSACKERWSHGIIRIEPQESMDMPSGKRIASRQPGQTLMLDLSLTKEELLAACHKKTRYNIRLAARKGVTIKQDNSIESFWGLYTKTTDRDNFRGHTKAYLEAMLTSSQAWVVTAYIEGNIPVASNIMWSDGKTTTYVHGASDHHYRAYMAPYLLQWHEICAAKERGERWYDFWGVAPLRASIDQCSVAADQEQEFWHVWQWPAADAWSGVTRFKAGFGGVYVRYGEAREIAIGWKGKLVQVMLQIRKMILKG